MTRSTQKALVTGGAGFIGSHITEALIQKGWKVTVIDNLSSGHPENLDGAGSKIEFIEGDIRDQAIVSEACKGCDIVFHHAAVVSITQTVSDPVGSTQVNELGTLNVLDAARQNDARRVVLASSSAVYGNDPQLPKIESMAANPLSPFALQKRTNEQYAHLFYRLYGLHTVCLRYFNVYGPRQNPSPSHSGVISNFMQRAATNSGPTIFGDGKQTRDFVYIEDVVQANMLAAEHDEAPGMIFNIGTSDSIEVNSLWDKIAHIAGCTKKPAYAPPRAGDIAHSLAGIQKARDKLGYQPSVSIERGLAQTYDWYRQKA